jgi:hypothetical protein
MATKGVLFTLVVDPESSLVDFCVDVNTNKHGSFVPLSGHAIEAPTVLAGHGTALTVLAMNENYRSEIEAECARMGIDAAVTGALELARE